MQIRRRERPALTFRVNSSTAKRHGHQSLGQAEQYPSSRGNVDAQRDDGSADHWTLELAGVGQSAVHEVDLAALPGGLEHLDHRGLQSAVSSLTPRRLRRRRSSVLVGLARAGLHADDLALALGVERHRHDHRHALDRAGFADVDFGCVDAQVRPVALAGASEKSFDPLVELLSHPWPKLFDTTHMPMALTGSSPERVGTPYAEPPG